MDNPFFSRYPGFMSFSRSLGLMSALLIGACLPVSAVLAADETVSSTVLEPGTADASSTPPLVFFHMADGRFFHPGTGLTAASEDELRHLIAGDLPATTTTAPMVVDSAPVATTTVPDIPLPNPLLVAIEQARAELQQRITADQTANPATIVGSSDIWVDVTLAVWSKSRNQLEYIDLQKKGTQIRSVKGTTESVKLVYSNGVNSAFRIGAGDDEVVVALRHPIFNAVAGKKNKYSLVDVVYTPYSQALHTPELAATGRSYLDEVVDRVYAKLRQDGIHSRVFPDRLAVDTVDPGVVKSIAAIEHLDQSGLDQDPRQALESFLIILAGNKGDSYAYSRSSAGALGLVQFIPSTYNRLAAQPALGLEKDFETGMRNPDNAIRAQVLYLDILMDEFPNSFRDRLAANPSQAQEFVVAAYNGGSSRVRKAMDSWDEMFNGQEAQDLAKLRSKYAGMQETIESLRQKTLRQTEKKARAKLQAQLDAQRVTAKKLLAQINTQANSLLRKETISYVLKYRALQQGELFPMREVTQVTTPTASLGEE